MDKLQFVFEMLDKVSAPAGTAGKSLNNVRIQLERLNSTSGGAQQQIERLSVSMGGAQKSARGWLTEMSSGLQIVGSLASGLMGLARGFLDAAAGAARFAVSQTAFHDSTVTGLSSMLGGRRQGRAEFARGLQLAQSLPGDTNDVIGSRRRLVGAGFRGRELDATFALQEDLANLDPTNAAQRRDSIGTLLAQVRGQDRLVGNDLMQLTNAGIGRGQFFDAIARARGLRGTETQQRTQARGLVSSGRVHGDEAIRGMISATEGMTGARIGQFSRDQGTSITGLMSNIMSAPSTIMQSLLLRQGGSAGSPGMSAFTSMLAQVNGLLDMTQPRGQRVLALFDRLINGVFGELRNIDVGKVFDTMLRVVESLVTWGTKLWNTVLKPLGSGIFKGLSATITPLLRMLERMGRSNRGAEETTQRWERVGQVIGAVVGVMIWAGAAVVNGISMIVEQSTRFISWLFDAWNTVTTTLSSWWESLRAFFSWERFVTFGENIGTGIAQGIRNGFNAAREAISNFGLGIIDRVRGVFNMHSPSRVMMELGGYVSRGFALGIENGAPGAGASLTNLINTPITGGAGGMRGGLNIGTIELSVHSNAGDPEAVAREVARLFPSALFEALEQSALEMGAA